MAAGFSLVVYGVPGGHTGTVAPATDGVVPRFLHRTRICGADGAPGAKLRYAPGLRVRHDPSGSELEVSFALFDQLVQLNDERAPREVGFLEGADVPGQAVVGHPHAHGRLQPESVEFPDDERPGLQMDLHLAAVGEVIDEPVVALPSTDQPDADAVQAQFDRVLDALEGKLPEWTEARRYLGLEFLARARAAIAPDTAQEANTESSRRSAPNPTTGSRGQPRYTTSSGLTWSGLALREDCLRLSEQVASSGGPRTT